MNPSFFKSIKRELKVRSRKITKLITKVHCVEEQELFEDAQRFTEEINEYCAMNNVLDCNVWNSDQSRFEYEMMTSRSYEIQGAKTVEAVVVSKNAVTHAYTLQVHISKAGYLGKKFYICFQESDEKFGPRIQDEINEAVQVVGGIAVVEASKSGKMTNAHADSWLENCFQVDVNENKAETLLLLDAWSGHKHMTTNDAGQLTIKMLPKSTTRFCQPLDVYFFRQYKIVAKKIVSTVRRKYLLEETTIKPNNRAFNIKMHAVVYNQLQSPLFRKMILYAWRKSGYEIDMEDFSPQTFENVKDLLFSFRNQICEASNECELPALIQCSHCRFNICFEHLCGQQDLHMHF